MQELDYLVTADDIAYLNHYHAQRSPTIRRNRAALGVSLTLIGVIGFLVSMATPGVGMGMMLLVVIAGVWVAMGRRRGPSRQQTEHIRQLFDEGKNRALFGHHHVRLLEEHVEVSTEFSRGEVRWEGVERVEQDEHYIFVYVSALNAYIINKKYFPSEQAAQRFFETARGYHQRALQLEDHSSSPRAALPAPSRAPAPPRGSAPERAPRLPERLDKAAGTDGSV